MGKNFLDLIKEDRTEPSESGNTFEGVENRLDGLKLLKIMAMKAHERTLRLQAISRNDISRTL